MSFDDAQGKCDQEFDLVQDSDGTLEYAPKWVIFKRRQYLNYWFYFRVVTFSSVFHLSIYFPSNFGEDVTKVHYIGLKGEFTQANRSGVVNAVYEARPMMKDHKQDVKEEGFARGPQF